MLSIIGLILLWILKIIGFILGFILLLILLVLFSPIKYDASGSYDEKIDVKVKFSYLFSFINGKFFQKDQEQDLVVRILFFKVYPKKEKKTSKKEKKISKKDKTSNSESSSQGNDSPDSEVDSKTDKASITEVESKSDNVSLTETENISESSTEKQKDAKSSEEKVENTDEKNSANKTETPKDKKTKTKVKKDKKEKKVKKDKKEKGPNKAIEQAKEFWAFLKAPENEGLLKHITKYLVKVIKWILPRKVVLDMEIGLEDPALTGYIAAVTSILYVITKKNIHVEPNFNESVIKGKFKIKGRLYLYQLLYYIIRVIIDKRVRRLIKKVRK